MAAKEAIHPRPGHLSHPEEALSPTSASKANTDTDGASTVELDATSSVRRQQFQAVAYSCLNIFSASAIVFANKAVFQIFHFKFVIALTLIHTVFTWVGMSQLAHLGFFTPKRTLQPMQLLPLAFGYIGYIVLGNLSLNLNSVGFYQIMKVAVAPTVLVLEFCMHGKKQSAETISAVGVVCLGITIATITDPITIKNTLGVVVGLGATLATALYQVWAGSKQKELEASSTQLLLAYTPQAIALLAILTPLFEPMGWQRREPGTLLGYTYTSAAIGAIIVSAALGVLVSLSTFLVIGATSSLSYNIVGHLKTVIILAGGCIIFQDSLSPARLAGLLVAMVGIVWYTKISVTATSSQSQASETRLPKVP